MSAQSPSEAQPRSKAVATARPLPIRGRFMTAVVLQVNGAADAHFDAALAAQMRLTPNFFVDAPLVLDLAAAEGLATEAELDALLARMRERRLVVFAVQGANAAQAAAARAKGLLALPGGNEVPAERIRRPGVAPEKTPPAPARSEAPAQTAAPAAAPGAEPDHAADAPRRGTRFVTEPVRSGQTVFAEDGDLVVLASVGSGAELVAAGSIHVYGTLRGRAIAGVSGDPSARIFAQDLDAELLAIAGLWRLSDDLPPDLRRARVQAYLQGDTLCVEPLK